MSEPIENFDILLDVETDEYGTANIPISVHCPQCHGRMIPRPAEDAWTEDRDVVVIPTTCEDCNFDGVVHLFMPTLKIVPRRDKPCDGCRYISDGLPF